MRNAGGYAVWSYDDGRVVEQDSFTCKHCQRVTFVAAKQDPATLGGLCKCCMGLTCARCAALGTCTPFERALDLAESRQRFLQSVGG